MRIQDRCTLAATMTAKRDGAFFKELQAQDITLTMAAEGEKKVSLSCFIHWDAQLELLRDHLCPVQWVNGIPHPMGEFAVATITREETATRKGWRVEAYDLCQLVADLRVTAGRHYLPAGSGYLASIQALLLEAGVQRVVADPSTHTLQAPREWELGTSYLAIVNALLLEMGFAGLWFDRDGVARLQRRAYAATQPPISYQPGEYAILKDGITGSTDLFDVPNVFTLVVSTPDSPPLQTVVVNDSPLSAASTVNRGRRICAPVQYLEGVASQAELDTIGRAYMFDAIRGTETVQFEVLPLPQLWYDDTILLQDKLYRLAGWDISLGFGGSYTITARREVLGFD